MMDTISASAFTKALMDPALAPPAGLKTWNGSDPERRFDVYRNNVVVSLIDALATTFPVTQALVGVDFFRAMARIYVGKSPPVSRFLPEYGTSFPDFIAQFPHTSELPYLGDVALLEHLRVVSHHAADATPLSAEAFSPLLADPERLLELRFELHPACRWQRSIHPVFSLWAAHQDTGDLQGIDLTAGEDVLVVRPVYEVQVRSLAPGAIDLLDALSGGASLAGAIDLVSATGVDFDLPRQLAGLINHGLLTRLIHPDGVTA
jgi:hypothetical protein